MHPERALSYIPDHCKSSTVLEGEGGHSHKLERHVPPKRVWVFRVLIHTSGLLIFRGKKAKFRGIFRDKFAKKSADFAGFSREESQNSRKNRPISGIFAGKKSKFVEKSADFAGFRHKNVKFRRIFRGKFLEKSADFTGNFVGKLRHETISKKQLISLDFGGEISLKSINFVSM